MDHVDILGIDLGTTNSAIAIWNSEQGCSQLLINDEGECLTPSVVTFAADMETALVGKPAVAQLASYPQEVIYSIKRFIGSTLDDERVRQDKENVPYNLQKTQEHSVVVRIAERTFTPSEISAEILSKLKHDAETSLGRPVKKAVITVPAYFNEQQREATRDAGQLAGLDIQYIVNEPTAATLAFNLGPELQTVAVYDMGGGTFDISLVEVDDGLFTVKATDGDTHLGGDDIDTALIQWLRDAFRRQYGKELPDDDMVLRAKLRREADQAKKGLSLLNQVSIHIPQALITDEQSFDLDVTLDRTTLDVLMAPFIERSLKICEQVLQKAHMQAGDIDQVLLVGGQTRSPAIKEALKQRFGWKLNDSVDPDKAVAHGAAILGARLCNHLPKEQVTLWDVIPQALGIELADGTMDHLLHANTQIPIERKKEFTTQLDGQAYIRFRIYQGDDPLAKNNTKIGEITLTLTAPRPKGEPRIKCIFTIDHNGILHVRAEEADAQSEAVEVTFKHMYPTKQHGQKR